MSDSAVLSASSVARYLQAQPDFFTQHAELFATLNVPHPYQDRVVSLAERQILVLRERVRALETQWAELIHEARRNEAISAQLKRWCVQVLSTERARVPEVIVPALIAQFEVPDAALRTWQGDETGAEISPEIRRYAETLYAPYCGSDASAAPVAGALGWLAQPPASFALMALRRARNAPAFGLLVLASDDPQRFEAGMHTDFLQDIGQLVSAALAV